MLFTNSAPYSAKFFFQAFFSVGSCIIVGGAQFNISGICVKGVPVLRKK